MSVINAIQPLTASVSIAIMKLIREMREPSCETVPIDEATNRVLACDIESPFSLPPFRRAAMDGYAICSAASLSASKDQPVRLTVRDEIRSGQSDPGCDLEAGIMDAIRIFTGAPVPKGCDTIVMQEAVNPRSGLRGIPSIQIDRPYPKGQHIAEKGEDVPQGLKILFRGTTIKAKEIAVLASFGFTEVTVYRKPAVAILPVGDELTLPGEELKSGRIYDANSYMISARLRELGASVIRCSPVPDCKPSIETAMKDALERADLVITTGGVSVGDYDYVKLAAESIGGEPLFTKVVMRPGTPTSAYQFQSKLLICLSGNPSACFAGLELLVRPVALKATGRNEYRSEWIDGRLIDSITKPSPYPRYARAFVYRADKEWMVEPLRHDKSGNVAAFARANALVLIPAGGAGASAGEEVRFVSLSI
ncbi:molybdopterin molybdotransferase MoeA [Paenibacillus alkaliterrae]|uniref:molybdopterin molybdotransferase MoeA n=1 Tax=Paenibacillus alkaliterrae TaxID=320909 RepID=UPI001F470415|nr:gephyrin-like molybdotransferase Glp [Paenibacillus alkaliterrae]MCF2941644.1 molybdopterin molybdotransferase MoeA [Paenibacillus alkaliterrae]